MRRLICLLQNASDLNSHRGITKGCTRSTHSGGCEVVSFSFVPGEPGRYLA